MPEQKPSPALGDARGTQRKITRTKAVDHKKRRTRTDHPRVKLRKVTHRSGAESWVARWRDPDSGREAQQSMEAVGRTTTEGRRAWAIDKAKELARRADALSLGATAHTGTALAEAVKLYFRESTARPKTVATYREGADRFLAWCEEQRHDSADDLRPAHLAAFRAWLRSERPKKNRPGGKRGEKVEGGKRGEQTASTTNNRLRSVKAILNQLRRRGYLPHVTREDVADRLRAYKEPKPQPAFLKPPELRKLLRAIEKHDAATCAMTREDKASGVKPGESTAPKHEPVAPFVLFSLLAGPRHEEALTLRWENVDLETPAGVVEIQAEDVKTGEARSVWLDVTPSLKRLLKALKLRATGPYVFGGEAPWTRQGLAKVRLRLMNTYHAPAFTWSQRAGRTPSLRATCATYSVNAGGIWGDAAHFASAKRLGHSVVIAEKRYAGRWRVPREAKDLEQAMEIADEIARLVDVATGARPRRVRTP